jgi:UDP-N-acetyl-D-glucosamine dehydrogenase
MKIICEKMGIDIYEVIHAASTKPFGFVPYFPGPGLGGHCIPIDPFYLTWKAKEYGVNTKFIELAGEINSSMPHYVISRTTEALNNLEKSVKGSKILVLGISYKKNIDDTRESPSIEIIHLLKEMGANVDYSDPYSPIFPKKRDYDFNLKSVELNASTLSSYDCVLVITNHDNFDYELINKHSKIIIDTRGVYKTSERIIRA